MVGSFLVRSGIDFLFALYNPFILKGFLGLLACPDNITDGANVLDNCIKQWQFNGSEAVAKAVGEFDYFTKYLIQDMLSDPIEKVLNISVTITQ